MRVGFLYLDSLQSGGYPRDVRWLAGHIARAGGDVSIFADPGPHLDALDGVSQFRPDQLIRRVKSLDIVHVWGIFLPRQLWLARAVHRKALVVISPMGHLIEPHLRRRGWKKFPYITAMRPLVSRWRPAAHLFSEVEREGARRYLRATIDFEASLGVFPSQPQAEDVEGASGDYILFFGRNDIYQKGLDLLLEGYAAARRRSLDLPLWIAGQSVGNSEDLLRSKIGELRLSGHVRVLGERSEGEKWALLTRAACLTFLSRWDGPPRPIREALAVGTPVVVTPGTNLATLVAESGAGAAVRFHPDDVARGLVGAGSDSTRRAWREGTSRLRETLSWPNVARQYIFGYESVLGELGSDSPSSRT